MTDPEPEPATTWVEPAGEPAPTPVWVSVVAWCARMLARLWVVSLLVFAAAFAGIAVYKSIETRAALVELRKLPGPQGYAAVAYRRELARQIRAFNRDWADTDAVPRPPPRPRLISEIDAARQRNADLPRPPPGRSTGRP